MRPRAIQDVPGLDPKASPFERFRQFAATIARIPKAEADKEIEKPSTARAKGKGSSQLERKMRRG
jgi:hypothetical protein